MNVAMLNGAYRSAAPLQFSPTASGIYRGTLFTKDMHKAVRLIFFLLLSVGCQNSTTEMMSKTFSVINHKKNKCIRKVNP